MYQSYLQKLTTLILIVGLAQSLVAQEPIYSYSFTDSLEGWTPEAISSSNPDSSGNALWVWTPNGNAGSGAFNNGATPIGSASGGGALLFDSDGLDNGGDQEGFGLGPAPSPQKGEITSPVLDFSSETRVLLSFYQYYRYFAKDDGDPDPSTADFNTPASSFEISNDGGATWISFEVNQDIGPNEATRATDIIVEDISDIAAGQSEVMLKFVWDGEYYFWLIDDVQFFNERGVDLKIEAFTNINNFETPDFMLANDTADLEIAIVNVGDADVTDSVMVWTRVLDNDLNLLYSDTGYFEGIGHLDTLIYDFENWTPDLLPQNGPTQNYILAYNVRVKGDTMGEVVKPDDNVDFNGFIVRDFSARKVPGGDGIGFSGATGTGEFEDFAWGNVFVLPPNVTESLEVARVTFDCFTTDIDNDPLAGKNVLVYLAELPYDSVPRPDTLLNEVVDRADINDRLLERNIDDLLADGVIGIGSYQFTQEDDESSDPFSVELTNFINDEEPVTLTPGNQYFAIVHYQGTANTIAQEVNQSYPMFQVSSMSYYVSRIDGFFAIGSINGAGDTLSYAENVASIALELQLSTAVDENPLPEQSVRVFPNPASDYVRVDVNFENPTDATVFIADLNGRILVSDTRKGIQSQQLTYDMTGYPSGSYIVRLSTKEGTKTEQIVVTH